MDSSRKADLLKRLEQSQQENARLSEENVRLVQENAMLRGKIDLLVRRIFGASSEKLDAAQLELLLGLQEAERGKVPASSALLEEAAPGEEKGVIAPRKTQTERNQNTCERKQ